MLSRNIKLENFKNKNILKKLKAYYKSLVDKKNDKKNLINTFTKSYSYSYNKQQLKNTKNLICFKYLVWEDHHWVLKRFIILLNQK